MKRWILIVGVLVTALAFIGATVQRAEAHPVPVADAGGGLASSYDTMFSATHALTRVRSMAAVPCVEATPGVGFAGPFPCKNVNLAAFLSTGALGGGTNSDIWGWTDPVCGREYALVGMSQSTVFVDVTIPEAPIVRGHIPFPRQGPTKTWPGAVWREVKTYSHDPGTPGNLLDDTHHAYIVQDLLGSGVQIFDLTRLRLPAPAPPCGVPPAGGSVAFDSDAVYDQQGGGPTVSNVHTITINTATGFAYLNGSNTCGAAPHMIDLKPQGSFGPENPRWVGCAGSDGYTHDAQCVYPYHGPDTEHHGKEICVLYNEDTLTVVDVTNKNNPVQLERQDYPNSVNTYTHQGWFTEDQRYIASDDELDEGTSEGLNVPMKTYLWNASDLNNLVRIDSDPIAPDTQPFTHPDTHPGGGYNAPSGKLVCIDHNQYVRGNLLYQSDYACGLRIYSLNNIAGGSLSEVAFFDTMPLVELSVNIGGDIAGDWSNYPYFASGTVVTSNITEGLFVLQPTLTPTAIKLSSFRAQRSGRHVRLAWRTASESDILGFNVFRDSQGKRVKITKSLIPAKGLARAGGAAYRLVDRTAPARAASTYRLQVVSKAGVRAWRATANVGAQ